MQEAMLGLEAADGAEPMAERTPRAVAHAGTWAQQRAAWMNRYLRCASKNWNTSARQIVLPAQAKLWPSDAERPNGG
jgi:hypothetical protein